MTRRTRAPRIGVTTYQEDASWRGWHRRASLVPRDFIDPLTATGAVPVLLPPVDDTAAATDLARWLDGVLLVGGPDVDPVLYDAPRDGRSAGVERARDDWELALLRAALAEGIAVLGVCRGMQLLNVACGGTLHQHIDAPEHRPEGSAFGRVRVALEAGALPGVWLGTEITVDCYHHQAVDVLGTGVVVTGRSADGTVESLQVTGQKFAVGVQWHPEVGHDARLFKAFVAAAGGAMC